MDFSLVVVQGLYVAKDSVISKACGILVPQPGTEPTSSALEVDSYPLDHKGCPTAHFNCRGKTHKRKGKKDCITEAIKEWQVVSFLEITQGHF